MTDENQQIHLIQTYGSLGPRFAGPDLLDYDAIFNIIGGSYDGETLHIRSAYHPCCGTLEVNASFGSAYKRWRNKLARYAQHRRAAEGDHTIRDLVRALWTNLDQIEDLNKIIPRKIIGILVLLFSLLENH